MVSRTTVTNYQDRFEDLGNEDLVPVVYLESRESRDTCSSPEAVGLLLTKVSCKLYFYF